MKSEFLLVGLILSALLGCDRLPAVQGAVNDVSSDTAVQAVSSAEALQAGGNQVEGIRELPQDEPALADQLAKFDAVFKSGNFDAYDHSFDSSTRFLSKYPIWTDLDCQLDEQRPETIWCAYGRMGELDDLELEGQLLFLANEDVLAPELRCSQVLCINPQGNPVGVIQPQMRHWITAHCSRSTALRLTCP